MRYRIVEKRLCNRCFIVVLQVSEFFFFPRDEGGYRTYRLSLLSLLCLSVSVSYCQLNLRARV